MKQLLYVIIGICVGLAILLLITLIGLILTSLGILPL